MCNWYKHDIPAWLNGTGNLSHQAYRLYHFICQQIYLNEGPIVINERGIAGQCNLRVDRFRVYLKELTDLGKLSVADGQITNGRCSKELAQIETNRANAGKGGRSPRRSVSDSSPIVLDEVSDSSRTPLDEVSDSSPHVLVHFSDAKLLKNKELGGVTLQNVLSLKTRLEKTREEKKDSCRVSGETPTKPPTKIYSDEFETNFWKPYPRTAIMSKKEAWREWMKLAPEQRQAACQAIEPYRKHLKQNPTLNAVHACRFLSQQRFDGILEKAAEQPKIDIRGHFV